MINWRIRFNDTDEDFFYETLNDLLEFASEYTQNTAGAEFSRIDSADDFGFGKLDDEVGILGVVGGGIKSTILFHLYPEFFPHRGQNAMYALFFLSEYEYYGLKSNEFVIADDVHRTPGHSLKMSQNYWYPYDLFTLYSMRIYNVLKKELKKMGYNTDDKYRFVYLEAFYDFVCLENSEYIKTMLLDDEFI